MKRYFVSLLAALILLPGFVLERPALAQREAPKRAEKRETPSSSQALAGTACLPINTGGVAVTENFDTLASTGTSNVTPTGWFFVETGTSTANDGQYNTGTGSSGTGDTYSFGAAASTERAFGGVQSGTLVPTIGACFLNNTGQFINQFTITYTGEQWRLGTADRGPDRLDFQFSLNATSIADAAAIWLDADALDFSSPVTTGAVGLRDGNAAANRTTITFTVAPMSIPPGSTFYVRWLDFNVGSADDGLAVDDFSLTPQVVTAAAVSINGRIVTASGAGVRNATVVVSGGMLSDPLRAVTNPFGFYRFEGLAAGQTYLVTVSARRHRFAESSKVVTLDNDLNNFDFVAEP